MRLTDLLLPKDCHLSILSITPQDSNLVIEVSSTQPTAICPVCQTPAHRVHGNYLRQPGDLPLTGDAVVLHLVVRRF